MVRIPKKKLLRHTQKNVLILSFEFYIGTFYLKMQILNYLLLDDCFEEMLMVYSKLYLLRYY